MPTDPTPSATDDVKPGSLEGTPEIDPESADALDGLLSDAGGASDTDLEAEPTDKPDDEPGDKPADDKPADDKPADDKPADDKPADDKPASSDDLDSVELPPYTKPNTAESFAKVKQLARERIAAIQKEREEYKAKLDELEKVSKEGLPPEAKTELEELRAFRQKLDVEADPAFKEWDTKVSSNVESIYGRLKDAGIAEETIAKIKEVGGPAEVDWDAISDKLPSSLKRYIEGKLFENEDLAEKKKLAMEAAKKNANEYIKTRQSEILKSSETRVKETEQEFNTIVPELKWLAEQKPTDKATDAEKKSIEAHNKLVAEVRADVKEAIGDDSPRMRAILISAYAQARRVRFEYDQLKASTAAQLESLQKELKDSKSLLERIKKSGTPRLSSSAPQSGKSATKVDYNIPAADALDNLLAEAEGRK